MYEQVKIIIISYYILLHNNKVYINPDTISVKAFVNFCLSQLLKNVHSAVCVTVECTELMFISGESDSYHSSRPA